ncbi:transcriptional activator NhaR [Janthinobacterium sp. SUN026]|uniref:transcriptional activator NhaR n=1 Tax=Janthinobacterium sp. SUN026 TaxID=3002438 RepID=UPI0025B1D230|nr:transcriptional activator NhaR [Janthinobacterium sp. SUN026]MDN2674518.1 transcriptional activator NhaR [Janthinobacterium sp. SUN026]
MKTTGFNYRHLYFFWVVAKEGGVTRAAERLGLAVQTISTQLALLEKELGKSLLQPQGRRLVPTEAGRLALGYADQIFLLGEQMQEALADTDAEKMRLTVGISDSLPKLMAYRMLDATRSLDKPVKLVCLEDEFESLLADLALHKLDLVLTDRAVPAGASLRVSSHLWGESAMKLFGIPALAAQYRDNFPHSLHGAPFLLPARNNALRGRIDEWMVQQGVRPDVVGEFEDNAMLNAFGRKGLGLFFASASLAADIEEQFGAVLVGDASSLREQFYVISNERKIMHPALDVILAAIQGHPKIHKET